VYTIFINNKPFIITNDWDYLINDTSYQHHYSDDLASVTKISQDLINNNKSRGLVLHASDEVKAFETFCSNYVIVEAAGGIVENELQQLLLIYRKGCWDLPKGRIEKDETEALAAKREVMEECGLVNVEVKGKLTTTYHTFYVPQRNVLKISHWYKMFCPSTDKLKPQTEEEITEIKWFVKSLLDLNKLDTYNSIHQVLELYLNKKAK
jgi:8-oxo-dGTP pyrophosphatase MutT (NUDIX family)